MIFESLVFILLNGLIVNGKNLRAYDCVEVRLIFN
jgi:hypothetical protein